MKRAKFEDFFLQDEKKADEDSSAKKKRKSRWAVESESEKSILSGLPTKVPMGLTKEQEDQYLLQLQIEEITRRLRTGELGIPEDISRRSPSPEPEYGPDGKRTNTREVRVRRKLEEDRHILIMKVHKANPDYKPPMDYKAPNIKIIDKVFIPQDEHPTINFIGLLLGPRGNTLKQLVKETGAAIIIRGKGSVKEGKVGYKTLPGQDEPLHAYITSNDPDCVKAACVKIRQIIEEGIAVPDIENELRKQQLRELALLNGTLKEGDALSKLKQIAEAQTIITNTIVCSICGGAGHITQDCKQKSNASDQSASSTTGGDGSTPSMLTPFYPSTFNNYGNLDNEVHFFMIKWLGLFPESPSINQFTSTVKDLFKHREQCQYQSLMAELSQSSPTINNSNNNNNNSNNNNNNNKNNNNNSGSNNGMVHGNPGMFKNNPLVLPPPRFPPMCPPFDPQNNPMPGWQGPPGPLPQQQPPFNNWMNNNNNNNNGGGGGGVNMNPPPFPPWGPMGFCPPPFYPPFMPPFMGSPMPVYGGNNGNPPDPNASLMTSPSQQRPPGGELTSASSNAPMSQQQQQQQQRHHHRNQQYYNDYDNNYDNDDDYNEDDGVDGGAEEENYAEESPNAPSSPPLPSSPPPPSSWEPPPPPSPPLSHSWCPPPPPDDSYELLPPPLPPL